MASFFMSPYMQRYHPFIVLIGIFAISVMCYLPGLHGGFVYDDIINIQGNPDLQLEVLGFDTLWQAMMSSDAGILKRPLSMLTFGLNNYWWGADPFYFKVVNLCIHLLNGLCIFMFSQLLLKLYGSLHKIPLLQKQQIIWISIGAAALWLLHPLNLTGVLYVVQRMASLSALFVWIGLVLYLYGRKRLLEQKAGAMAIMWISVLAITPIAVLSKENGLLLPFFMLVIEFTVLKWDTPDKDSQRFLILLFLLFAALPTLIIASYILIYPEVIFSGYQIRDFTVWERLLTEARVVWFYLYVSVIPDITQMGLYHDDITVSRNLFSPLSTFFSVIGLIGALVIAWLSRMKHPLIAFGILFFLIGHSMESSVIPLELAHEHRNYLPLAGLLIPGTFYLLSPIWITPSLTLRKAVFFTMLIVLSAMTWLRANSWSDPFNMSVAEVRHHPNSPKANADMGFRYAYLPVANQAEADINYLNAIHYFTQAANLTATDTSGFFGILGANSERGLPTDATWTDELARRLESAPMSPSSINSLVALEKCLVAGRCTHSPQLMESLLRAAARNPSLTGPSRSTLLFALSDFLYKIQHQTEPAVEAAYMAASAAPTNFDQQELLIIFLINMGKFDAAKTEIAKARSLYGTSQILAQLEFQLNEVKAQSGSVQ